MGLVKMRMNEFQQANRGGEVSASNRGLSCGDGAESVSQMSLEEDFHHPSRHLFSSPAAAASKTTLTNSGEERRLLHHHHHTQATVSSLVSMPPGGGGSG